VEKEILLVIVDLPGWKPSWESGTMLCSYEVSSFDAGMHNEFKKLSRMWSWPVVRDISGVTGIKDSSDRTGFPSLQGQYASIQREFEKNIIQDKQLLIGSSGSLVE